MSKGKYYLTTAIAYASGKPHIGNTYEIILADAICRYKKLEGYDVYFQTGTDEHGIKIEEKAKAAGMSPKEYVDMNVKEIKRIFDMTNNQYDHFIRTTDDYHEKQVQKIFRKLYEQGDIYKGEYEGWYCVPDETFYTDSQIVWKDGVATCPDCGREVKKAKEEAYFFKMSKYADRLLKHIEENPQFIQPESRKNEMINNFIKPGLQDLCVSRTSFTWGIPVDFDPKHVVYVWIDALANYITGLGYDVDGNHGELFKKYWPADVHLIGKDILRFHTIYWPIMLMALGVELPKQIFGHPWLLVGDGKMSKSRGNVIYADDLIEKFGVDPVRFFVLHEMPFAQDGSITYELMVERYNSHLVNILGNLVNRTITMANKYFGGVVKRNDASTEFDSDLIETINSKTADVAVKMANLRVADAIDDIFDMYKRLNKYIDETTPWILAKDENEKDKLEKVLYNLFEGIRIASTLLSAYLPDTGDKILTMLNTRKDDYDHLKEFATVDEYHVVEKPEILFNRIDEEEFMKQFAPKEPEYKKTQPEVGIEDFAKLDIVVGNIVSCSKHPQADKLLVFDIDLGEYGNRQIVSSIAKFYKPEELVGKNVAVVLNLKPIKLRGVESKGMILTAASEDGKQLKVLESGMPAGTKIS
ncbi:MAG: methionine--tRNA ligase [Erysipelotrichaceae bacterium]|nr:methionine--tRNA ligase [Erysipelotrichaceae bacterium]